MMKGSPNTCSSGTQAGRAPSAATEVMWMVPRRVPSASSRSEPSWAQQKTCSLMAPPEFFSRIGVSFWRPTEYGCVAEPEWANLIVSGSTVPFLPGLGRCRPR